MRFAREVSNRVLFLTNGGIYEDGTPEQIFGHPQRELTRRFIRQLKVYENQPEEAGFDFPAVMNDIEQFCIANRVPQTLTERLLAATEELTMQILPPEIVDGKIYVCVEYDEQRTTVYVKFRYGREAFDPRSSDNGIALAILNKQCGEIEYNASESGKYVNEVVLHIK